MTQPLPLADAVAQIQAMHRHLHPGPGLDAAATARITGARTALAAALEILARVPGAGLDGNEGHDATVLPWRPRDPD